MGSEAIESGRSGANTWGVHMDGRFCAILIVTMKVVMNMAFRNRKVVYPH